MNDQSHSGSAKQGKLGADLSLTHLDRFLRVMEYQPVDRLPNWEAGVWGPTMTRWESEGMDPKTMCWDWFTGEEALGLDPREFIRFHGGLQPGFPMQVLEEDKDTRLIRDSIGRVRREFKPGSPHAGAAMDTYLRFAVETREDWEKIKPRLNPHLCKRYEPCWRQIRVPAWRQRQHPLIFAPNCSTMGFYWLARDLMGTENLSLAWYDQPELMHDMMAFWGDFLIQAAKPILEATSVDYICLAEDLSMKTGPLLSPDTYRTFIYPHLKRFISFVKSHGYGCRYICIDTDGNPEVLIPMMLDAGIDCMWPMERAAEQDPCRLRRKFGQSLRLWGGVDKRELVKGPTAIDAHLRTLQSLAMEGGFIPTIDHTVPPDVSWDNFRYYMDSKRKLLAGRL